MKKIKKPARVINNSNLESILGDKIVWSGQHGDMRKKNEKRPDIPVNEKDIILKIRRLTSGKGRTVIEITGLPQNKKWCQALAKELKKKLGVGGSYKENTIEIHGEKIDLVTAILDKKNLKWKKTGG